MPTIPKRLVIFNPLIVTMNENFEIIKGDIFIEDGRIKLIGKIDPREWTKKGSYEIIYASDKIALPGLIQTHTHICQTLFRGLADNLSLFDWLQKKIFPLESAHNENSMRASARLGLAELLKCGTTTILDMGSVHFQDTIFEEARNFGIRYIGGKSLVDCDNPALAGLKKLIQKRSRALNDVSEQIKNWHNSDNGRLQYALAPRFILSCSNTLLKDISALAEEKNLLIHTHCAENLEEENLIKQKTGKSSVQLFNECNLLSKKTNLAHCVHLSDTDLKILHETETNITHCPASNLKLSSGIANIVKFLKNGINVSLGCDGVACNNRFSIFQEMHISALLQSGINSASTITAKEILQLATINAAKALNLSSDISRIEVGKKADIILINTDIVSCIGGGDLYSKIVYSPDDSFVDTVIVDGNVLVKQGKLFCADERSIISDTKSELTNLLKRANI